MADETNNELLRKPFFKVKRKSIYVREYTKNHTFELWKKDFSQWQSITTVYATYAVAKTALKIRLSSKSGYLPGFCMVLIKAHSRHVVNCLLLYTVSGEKKAV